MTTYASGLNWVARVSSPALMINDLPATASTPPEEALPVRKRATAAETRLTPAEWGLLSILTLMQFSVTIDFIIIAPLGPQLMRVFGHRPVRLDCGRLCFRCGALQLFGGVLSGSF